MEKGTKKNVSDIVAKQMVELGHAKLVDEKPKKPTKEKEKPTE